MADPPMTVYSSLARALALFGWLAVVANQVKLCIAPSPFTGEG
jgi:hypothetical protein